MRDEKIFKFYLFSCRGNTLEVALVGAAYLHVVRHHIIFGYLILHRVMQVRKGGVKHGNKLPKSFAICWVRESGKVCYAIRDEKFVNCRYVFVQFL